MTAEKKPVKNRLWLFLLLVFVGGFLGGFTHEYRGGVFANAQTGNLINFGVALSTGNVSKALHCFCSFIAYTTGAFTCQRAMDLCRKSGRRWECILLTFELAMLVFLALLPSGAPFLITQVGINLMASMQYHTFKGVAGVNMATTFVTNHTRNLGVALEKTVFEHDPDQRRRIPMHLASLGTFILGVCCATVTGRALDGFALLICLPPVAVNLAAYLRERES